MKSFTPDEIRQVADVLECKMEKTATAGFLAGVEVLNDSIDRLRTAADILERLDGLVMSRTKPRRWWRR
jgi:hypothetical protein